MPLTGAAAFAVVVDEEALVVEVAGVEVAGDGVGTGVGDAAFASSGVEEGAAVCAIAVAVQMRLSAQSSATLLKILIVFVRLGRRDFSGQRSRPGTSRCVLPRP
jgi:hypothetical protein